MAIKTWWERLNCTSHLGKNNFGEEVTRDEEIAGLHATIERQAQEIAALKSVQPAEWMHTLSEGEFGDSGWNVQFLRTQKEAEEEMRVHGGTIKELFSSQPSIEVHEQDIEQLARSKWTVKQWYEHVGAWENAQGEVCFGSVMALGAMLKLMAKARHFAVPLAQQDAIDAARYRFLRKGFGDMGPDVDMHNAFVDGDEKMDEAIDAARTKEQPQ